LLQLNTIPLNGKQPIGKAGLDRNPILGDCALRQYNYLVDRFIEDQNDPVVAALS
jgi:hypothetical protein